MAKLYFYYSAMNAGKTTTLLQSAYNYRERGMRAVILTPKLDHRGGSGTVASRIGLQSDGIAFDRDADLLAVVRADIATHGTLPGCGIELLLPGAYYVACREADKAIRPISLRAAVNYLTTALAVEPGQLEVVIAGFGDEANGMRIDELRISFGLGRNPYPPQAFLRKLNPEFMIPKG